MSQREQDPSGQSDIENSERSTEQGMKSRRESNTGWAAGRKTDDSHSHFKDSHSVQPDEPGSDNPVNPGNPGNRPERPQEKKKSNWMFGAAGLLIVSKLKTLFVLLKSVKFLGAFISMLVTIAAYAIAFTFKYAVGVVLLIFVHEMGHVIAAKRKGLPVSAPIFIPFIGALVAMKRNPRDAVTEAYIAFAGPLVGTIGALAVYGIGVATNNGLFYAIAFTGFFINAINLLPIHPLDGGRISTAVTRWLWLAGLVGGLALIIYLQSILFFIIWALFAWEMYQKYVKYGGKGKPFKVSGSFSVNADEMRRQGMLIPGEGHKRDLSFVTHSSLDGKQTVEINWEAIGLYGRTTLPVQAIVRKVHVINIVHEPRDHPETLSIVCQIDCVEYENVAYYDVPIATRWKFGIAYGALAVFLLYMMHTIQQMDLTRAM